MVILNKSSGASFIAKHTIAKYVCCWSDEDDIKKKKELKFFGPTSQKMAGFEKGLATDSIG